MTLAALALFQVRVVGGLQTGLLISRRHVVDESDCRRKEYNIGCEGGIEPHATTRSSREDTTDVRMLHLLATARLESKVHEL